MYIQHLAIYFANSVDIAKITIGSIICHISVSTWTIANVDPVTRTSATMCHYCPIRPRKLKVRNRLMWLLLMTQIKRLLTQPRGRNRQTQSTTTQLRRNRQKVWPMMQKFTIVLWLILLYSSLFLVCFNF